MDDITFRNLRKLKRPDNKNFSLIRRGRLINKTVYCKLKNRKFCDYCHKSINGEVPQIHHIIPIKDGGTNMENNLIAVHKSCHDLLDTKLK